MALPQLKYNPGFRGDEELIRSFVVREHYLELILETLRENTGPSNQHVLVIGPRGIGKTMLVLRVAAEVRANLALSSQWFPLVFPEEAYEVLSPGEFWLEALFHLADQTKDSRWYCAYKDLKAEHSENRLRERALAQLMDFADEQGKRILLIVENLNMLLGEQLGGHDDWDLRHTLQNEPRLMLLGTATTHFKEIESIDKAWFELFSFHELKPLDQKECRTLWEAVSGVKVLRSRLRPIQILTGGNPRLLKILAAFAAKRSFRELMDHLLQLIDDHTEYFKSHLDSLAAAERKVFVILLDFWSPANAREVAQAARMDVSKVSALLHRLVDRGAVMVVNSSSRKKLYQAVERLYNIYYLLRRRGHPSNRVRAVVIFMVQFYEGEELVKSAAKLAEEAGRLDPERREDLYWAYQEIVNLAPRPELKRRIVQATPDDFFTTSDIPDSVRSLANLLGVEQPELPYKAQTKMPSEEDGAFAVEPQDAAAWIQRGDALQKEPERLHEAEQAYREALKLDPHYPEAWASLGELLHERLDRFEEAEQLYRKAIELEPDYAWAWANLGRLLHEHLERYDGAEQAYRKAIELIPDSSWAWSQLGVLLQDNLERYEEAEQAYRKAIELEPDYAWAWANLGLLLYEHLDRYEEAEQAYRETVKLEPNVAWGWAELSQLLHRHLKRYNEAEQAYLATIDLQGRNSWVWPFLIELRLTRGDDPQTVYHQAQQYLEQSERTIENLNDLAWVFYEAGLTDYLADAELWAREAAAKKADDWNVLHTLVTILGARGKWKEALELALSFLDTAATEEDVIRCAKEFLIPAAAAGYAKEILKMVTESQAAEIVEPLTVGLQIFLNERPHTAQEIFEIGQDVAQRIREQQQTDQTRGS